MGRPFWHTGRLVAGLVAIILAITSNDDVLYRNGLQADIFGVCRQFFNVYHFKQIGAVKPVNFPGFPDATQKRIADRNYNTYIDMVSRHSVGERDVNFLGYNGSPDINFRTIIGEHRETKFTSWPWYFGNCIGKRNAVASAAHSRPDMNISCRAIPCVFKIYLELTSYSPVVFI